MKSKAVKAFIFTLLSWTIYNALLFFEAIYLLAVGQCVKAAELIQYFYTFAGYGVGILSSLSSLNEDTIKYIVPLFISSCLAIVTVCITLRLWWKKQTLFRAFLLALAGATGPLAFTILLLSIKIVMSCFCAMCACFALIAIFNKWRIKYRPNLDLSPLLIWRRPWG